MAEPTPRVSLRGSHHSQPNTRYNGQEDSASARQRRN